MSKELFDTRDMGEGPFLSSAGTTDLMTSLAVICMLLFAAHVTTDDQESPQQPPIVHSSAADQLRRLMEEDKLTVVRNNEVPYLLSVVVPDSVLNFEFGKSALSPEAAAFLTKVMPRYAAVLCGPRGEEVETLLVEGHTDDQGDEIRNLKLSQDRSHAVLSKGLSAIRDHLPWAYGCFQRKVSASGRGSHEPMLNAAGFPDREKSRRVVFKLYLRSGWRG